MNNQSVGSIVLTGSSTGIGAACARYLADRGYRVFAGVRKESDAARLRSYGNPRLEPIILDISSKDLIASAVQAVAASLCGEGLTALVNNAGVSYDQPLECVAMDSLRHQFEVNVIGTVRTTQAFLPMLRQSRGRVVNVGSISGVVANSWSGPYCMSKHAIEAFSDVLRQEMAAWGVHVSLIEPGAVKTEIWTKALAYDWAATASKEALALYGDSYKHFRRLLEKSNSTAVSPSKVSEAVLHAVSAKKPRTRYLVGSDARMLALMARLLPDRVLDRILLKALADS